MTHAISQRHNLLGSLTLACVMLLGAACSDDPNNPSNNASNNASNNFIGGEAGSITLSSTIIEFNQVPLGSTDTKELTITNTGGGTLILNKITLVENDEDDQREISPGEGWKNKANLKPNESLTLTVKWTPKTTIRDTGKIVIESNDPKNSGITEVLLNSPLLAPKLFSPPVVSFPRVPTGTTQKLVTFIQNTGQSPLQLKGVILSPPSSTEFTVTFPDPADQADESKDKSIMDHVTLLEPNEQIPMRVAFTPDSDQPSTADIVLYSSDPNAAQYTIKLSGNAGTPCIEIGGARTVEVPTADETHLLQFGASQIGRATNKTVQIRNCSRSEELTVSEIVLSDDASGVYELVEAGLPGDLPASPLKVAALESETFIIAYTPEDETTSVGRVEVRNDDPVNSTIKVDINGKGTLNSCPTAVAEATIVNGSGRASAMISTIPLKTVELTGLGSTDDGSVAGYEWNVIQKPVNSTARLQPNNNAAEPRLFLDLAGEYVVELTVRDNLGLDSCETATVRIQATPDEDIHVQLVWDTPGDADQTDPFGTDVDLHYLHPLGKWNESPYDIFWRNPSADWGIPGNTSDDPSLDIDDTDGAGPENVNHDNPQSGKSYAVGAYYYNDNGYGPIYATIRIYIEGTEQFKLIDKYMEREDSFWDVAAIVWPSKQIIARDRVRLGFP